MEALSVAPVAVGVSVSQPCVRRVFDTPLSLSSPWAAMVLQEINTKMDGGTEHPSAHDYAS